MFGIGNKKIDVKKGKENRKKDYYWEGRNKSGKKTSGTTPALSSNDLRTILIEQNITPIKIKVKQKSLFGEKKSKIKSTDIVLFTRQITTMLRSGTTIVGALEIVADSTTNNSVKDLIVDIKNEITNGSSFADALMKHPDYFDDLYCNLVASAEKTGNLEDVFESIAIYKEKTEAIKKKIKKAMTYPIAVLTVAGIVTLILLLKVVPQFEEMFSSFGAKLPAFTQFVLDLSEFMKHNWMFVVGGVALTVYSFKQARKRIKSFNNFIEAQSLKLPIVGDIIRKSSIARFSRTLSTTASSGVPIPEGLEASSGAAGNYVYSSAVLKVRDQILTGQSLTFALQATTLFPPMVTQMALVGEESGRLDEMLGKIATLYEDEVDDSVENLTSLLEPMIMAVLGILVGGLIIAMYLPVFKMGSAV